MTGFLVRRLLQSVAVIIGVIAFMFILIHLIPGGEARAVLGPRAQPGAIENFDRVNGLDLPLWDQFAHYLGNLATFHLGRSYIFNQTVVSLIAATTNTSTNLDAYQNYLSQQLPNIWQPNADYELTEVRNTIRGIAPQNPFANLFPEYWYYVKS